MRTMIDEIFDRNYQSARSDLNGSITRGLAHFGKAAGNAFRVLQGIQFSAPWTGKPDHRVRHS